MKAYIYRRTFLFPMVLLAGLGIRAGAAVTVVRSGNPSQTIPDGSALGLSQTITIAGQAGVIVEVGIGLHVSGGFNGDIYALLIHGSGAAILMNRVGRTMTNEFGYGDSGFDIDFSDAAPGGDVHGYRTALFGNEATSLAGALSGTWSPDGRPVDPDSVTDDSSRDAMLGTFAGADPNGDWTLFIADLEGGGIATLTSWSLQLTLVPEPEEWLLVSFALAGLCLRRARSCLRAE